MTASSIRPFLRLWLASLALLAGPVVAAPALSADWVAQWRTDLHTVAEIIAEVHPAPFQARDRADFEADLEALSGRLPELAHHQIALELQRIIVRLEDGHTRLTLPLEPELAAEFFQGHSRTPPPKAPDLLIGHLPLRLGLHPEGLFVQRVERTHRDVLGRQVVGIGGIPIADAMARVAEIIHRDNEHTIRDHLPSRLVMPEVLHALGLAPSRFAAAFELEGADGRRQTLELRRVPSGRVVDWADARIDPAPPTPGRPDRNFWLERLEEHGAVHLKLIEIENEDDETLADLATRLTDALADPRIDTAILDLRGCHGGDHSLTRPLLHAVIRADDLRPAGRLYVLTDRSTFSAATMFALDLERHTLALFVGEPTSGKPNSYGDSRKSLLPSTGLTLRVSTRYWQNHPLDDRTTIPVQVPIVPSFDDYRAGRDPVLSAVLTGAARLPDPEPRALVGRWLGTMEVGRWSFPLDATFSHHDTEGWSLAVEGFETRNLRVIPPEASFEFAIESGVIAFEATVRGLGLFGEGTYQGRTVKLALRRP